MTYFLVALYLLILVYFYDLRGNRSNRTFHYFLSFFILVFVAGIRYRMAPDTVIYMMDFQYRTKTLGFLSLVDFKETRYQPFWILLNSFCKTVYNNFVFMQIVTAFILHASIYYFFNKSTSKFFSCVLFYFLMNYVYFSMEIMRESLAVGMYLIAFIKYNEKKYYQFLLFLCFAIMFHSFAVFLFLTYFYMSKLVPQKLKIFLTIVALLFLIFTNNPLGLMKTILSGSIGSQVELYQLIVLEKMTFLGYVYIVLRILPAIIVMIYYRKRTLPFLKVDQRLLSNLTLVYVVIVIVRATTIPFIERFGNYFIFFVILFVDVAFFDFIYRKVIRPFQFSALSIAAVVVTLFYVLPMIKIDPFLDVPFYKRYYPYYTIFSEKRDPDREFIIRREGKEY